MITMRHAAAGAIGIGASILLLARASGADPGTFKVPASLVSDHAAASTETAIFSDGCFWGVQGVFQHVRGVTGTTAGYDGGAASTASYETVSTGTTGHAETVAVTFDPREVSYATLLRVFFSVAGDPTEINRQTPDTGPQYRSVLWVRTAAQHRIASAYVRQLDAAHVFARPIATEVETDHGFFPAEPYHQNFLVGHRDDGYIALYDLPKIASLHRLFPAEWRPDPMLAPAQGVDAGS